MKDEAAVRRGEGEVALQRKDRKCGVHGMEEFWKVLERNERARGWRGGGLRTMQVVIEA